MDFSNILGKVLRSKPVFLAVLWIRDMLVRIRIRWSMSLTYGSGSCFFRQWLTRCQQKIIFFAKFFCLLLFECTFTSVFIDKKSKNSQKIVEIKVFLLFCLVMEGSGSTTLMCLTCVLSGQVLCNNPKKYAVVEPEGRISGQKCVDIVIRYVPE